MEPETIIEYKRFRDRPVTVGRKEWKAQRAKFGYRPGAALPLPFIRGWGEGSARDAAGQLAAEQGMRNDQD
jgi:hypothetical protein